MADNRVEVVKALRLLGTAWRGDWSDFDGRQLRGQLDDIADRLADDAEPFDAAFWLAINGICPEYGCWCEHCPEQDATYRMQCAHETAERDRAMGRTSDDSATTPAEASDD